SMHRRAYLRLLACAALPAVAAGCGTVAQGVSPLPDRYPLAGDARMARLCAPQNIPRELNKQWLARYPVQPGARVLILPADLESKIRMPSDQTILADGTIDLGKYGRLLVGGRTVPEIEEGVKAAVKAVEKDEDVGFIDVRLVNRQSKVYYVLGE